MGPCISVANVVLLYWSVGHLTSLYIILSHYSVTCSFLSRVVLILTSYSIEPTRDSSAHINFLPTHQLVSSYAWQIVTCFLNVPEERGPHFTAYWAEAHPKSFSTSLARLCPPCTLPPILHISKYSVAFYQMWYDLIGIMHL